MSEATATATEETKPIETEESQEQGGGEETKTTGSEEQGGKSSEETVSPEQAKINELQAKIAQMEADQKKGQLDPFEEFNRRRAALLGAARKEADSIARDLKHSRPNLTDQERAELAESAAFGSMYEAETQAVADMAKRFQTEIYNRDAGALRLEADQGRSFYLYH